MKKLICVVILAAMLMTVLCACGKTESAPSAYTFKCVDSAGKPVANVTLQICTDEKCEMATTDSNGVVTYAQPAAAYEVHVLKCPEGYSYDKEAVYTTAAEYETVTFTLETAK